MPFPDDATHIGTYRALRLIGAGGMGRVYACHDEDLDREVAIKVLLPELAPDEQMVERFLREGRAMAKVVSPHVVTIFQIGRDERGDAEGGTPFIVMELLEGKDLADILKEDPDEGRLELNRAVTFARDTLAGLKAAAQAGLVHRDIKPANLFVVKGRVKITDFGLARPLDGSQNLTATGLVVGSPHYLAPELARGQDATHASDIYALGCTLFETLAGRPPYVAKTPIEVITAHIKETTPDLRTYREDVPFTLVSLIKQMMAKAPEARPTDFDAIEEAMAKSVGESPRPRGASLAPVPVVNAAPAVANTEQMFGDQAASGSIPWANTGDVEAFDTAKDLSAEEIKEASADTESAEAIMGGSSEEGAAAKAGASVKRVVENDDDRVEAAGQIDEKAQGARQIFIAAAAAVLVSALFVWAVMPSKAAPAKSDESLAVEDAVVVDDARIARIDAGDAQVVLDELASKGELTGTDLLIKGHALASQKKDDDAIQAIGAAAKAGVADARARDFLFAMMDDARADDIIEMFKSWPDPSVDSHLRRLALEGEWFPRHHAIAALEARGKGELVDMQAVAIRDFTEGESCNKRSYGLNMLRKHGRDAAALKVVQDADFNLAQYNCITDADIDGALKDLEARAGK